MPIRLRLALLFALGTTAVIAMVGLGFVRQLHRGLLASVDAGLRTRMDALSQSLSGEGQGGDGANFQDSGSGGPLPAREALAQVLDSSGRVIEGSEAAAKTPLLSPAQVLAAAHRPVYFTRTVGDDKGRTRLLAVPVAPEASPASSSRSRSATGPSSASAGAGTRVAVVGSPLETTDDAVNRVRHALFLGALPAVGIAGLGAWVLAGAALRPVERMRRQAADISAHDADLTLAVPSTRDELAALASTMNGLLSRLQDALRRQREFVADAGHELRTPLAILGAELELAARPGRTRSELATAVSAAVGETARLTQLAEDLLALAGGAGEAPLHRVPIEVSGVVEAAIRAADARSLRRGVRLECEAEEEVRARVDAGRLRQAVDNLVDNALRHAPSGTAITVAVSKTERGGGEGKVLRVEVRDRGVGFPEEFLPHAFERFRRADPARARGLGGSGLGLAIVRSIAEAHGGRAFAGNRSGGGACVGFELPLEPSDQG